MPRRAKPPAPPPKPERRPRGSGTIRELAPGVVQAQVRIRGAKGRPTETFHAADTPAAKLLAEAWIAEQHRAAAHPNAASVDSLTVRQLVDNWLATRNPKRPNGTRRNQETSRRLMGPLLDERAASIRGDTVQRWLNELDARGLAATTRRGAVELLARVYRDSIRWGLARHNPVDETVTRPKRRAIARPALNERQARAFMALAAADELAAFWSALLETGCRQAELRGLRWQDVDWERSRLRIVGQVDDRTGEYRPETKGKRQRTLVASPELMEELAALRASSNSEYVFAQPDGSPWRGHQIRYRLGRLLRRAHLPAEAIPAITPHGLRHSNARIALRRGVPLKHVQARLGHRSIAITADLYGSLEAEDLDEFPSILGEALRGPKSPLPGADGSEFGSGF